MRITESVLQRKLLQDLIARERREYSVQTELAKDKTSKHLSISVDGAHQSKLALPRFVSPTKEELVPVLHKHLICVIEHTPIHHLRLYTMTHNHYTGADHIVEAVHKIINDKVSLQKLRRKLFVQMVNYSREKKNNYLMGCIEYPVQWKVFEEIEAYPLPVGHSPSDIDQGFSSTARLLRAHDAVKLRYLHQNLSQCFIERTTVTIMDTFAIGQ